MNATIVSEFKRDREHFVSGNSTCWNCGGPMKLLGKPEIYKNEGMEYERVKVCEKCGSAYSYFTFTQYEKNRKATARHILKDSKEARAKAREDYDRTIDRAKDELSKKLAEINAACDRARMVLARN